MCGILGVFDPEGVGLTSDAVRRALDLLAERGPDDQGWYEEPGVFLGHRRLSVMDLSEAGREPMANEDGTLQVTFNGEIYGFQALREELQGRGHTFRSHADTEVLLHGYEEWGRGLLERIDGMFAFALWDARKERLLLARDRLGKKPLFFSRREGTLAFCSQLRPLVACGAVRPVVRRSALREFLYLGYVLGPQTIFEDAELLPPGSWLEVSRQGVETGSYWDLAAVEPEEGHAPQERFEELLLEATRTRLISDAPLGVFLSGGVDSALVAALAQRESASPRSTFSVGFDDPSYDERHKARAVARRLGTEHHEIVCGPDDVPAALTHLTRSADHLLADQSMVPLALLALEAKKSVKVVLTGDGGDEILAGYPTYRALRFAAPYIACVPRPLRRAVARGYGVLPTSRRKMALSTNLGRFLQATVGDLPRAHASWRRIWSHDEIDSLLGESPAEEWGTYAGRMGSVADMSLLRRAVQADIRTWLVDSILAKVDRATMATGLEARSPLLDSRVVEYCFGTLLRDEKEHAGKQPIRRFARRVLGDELASTPKEPFQTPFSRWFAGPLQAYVRERIDDLERRFDGSLRADVLRRVEAEHAAGTRDHGLELWNVTALAEWASLYPDLRLGEQANGATAPTFREG